MIWGKGIRVQRKGVKLCKENFGYVRCVLEKFSLGEESFVFDLNGMGDICGFYVLRGWELCRLYIVFFFVIQLFI